MIPRHGDTVAFIVPPADLQPDVAYRVDTSHKRLLLFVDLHHHSHHWVSVAKVRHSVWDVLGRMA